MNGFSVVWVYLTLPRTGPGNDGDQTWLQGQVSEGYLSWSLRPEGWRVMSHMSGTSCFQRANHGTKGCVFSSCIRQYTHVQQEEGEESWVIYTGDGCYLQEHGLPPTALLGCFPQEDMMAWEEEQACC